MEFSKLPVFINYLLAIVREIVQYVPKYGALTFTLQLFLENL